MQLFTTIVSIVTGIVTIGGFIGIFVKYGKDKGKSEMVLAQLQEKSKGIPDSNIIKELRKDVDANAKDINALGSKVNQIQLDNMQVVTALSSDLGWIKSSLTDIKQEMLRSRNDLERVHREIQ